MIKSAGIYKFNSGKTIVHSEKNVKDSASYASEPYYFGEGMSYIKIALDLQKALEYSIYDSPPPLDWKALQKNHLKSLGVKTMKTLHDGSLYVSVFIKDGMYNIAPSINKGARQGFQYTKEKIVIPESSDIDKIAQALEEAFNMCS